MKESDFSKSKEGGISDLGLEPKILPHGYLSFRSDFYEPENKPYIKVKYDEDPNDIVNVMAQLWKLPCPSIVLLMISSMEKNLKNPNHPQWKNFEEGLIKAANTTPMWILTNGSNAGVAKLIGDTISKEEQRRQAQVCSLHPYITGILKFPKLTLIGIMNHDTMIHANSLIGKGDVIEITNEGNKPLEGLYELNPDHTHFIIVKDDSYDKSGMPTFIGKLANCLIHNALSSQTMTSGMNYSRTELPFIGLLNRGGFSCARLVLELLKQQVPIVVLKESGGTADLLSYAFEEIKEKNRGEWDPEYVEVFVKSELSQRIAVGFPKFRENNLARNRFRDKVIECIRYSYQDDQLFLTFPDIYSHRCNLAQLDKYLLKALFQSQIREGMDESQRYDQLQKNLYLTLDWNSPLIALKEVFQKDPAARFKVDKSVFEQALLRQNREEFVDLFLDQGFQVHKFLTEKRLKRLFDRAESPQFFHMVCWEVILGHGDAISIGRDFITKELNWLIHSLTQIRDFIPVQELTSNAMGFYTTDPVVAERKAFNSLIMWAVLMDRPKLVKVLWKRTDHPVHFALLISMMYSKMARNVKHQVHLHKYLEDLSKEFEEIAIGVLDVSCQENNCRATDILSERMPDWNYQSAVELAYAAHSQSFIGHPCCQKYLSDLFMGDIHIHDLKWGLFDVPKGVKIILSAIFIFPMYFWIHFKTDRRISIAKDPEDVDNEVYGDSVSASPKKLIHPEKVPAALKGVLPKSSWIMKPTEWHKIPRWQVEKPKTWYYRFDPQPFLQKKIYLLWSAPITKFWMFQLTYFLYLGFYSYVMLLPSCGDSVLDLLLWFWTLLIMAEIIRRTYLQARQLKTLPVKTKCLEILLVTWFLLCYFFLRIYPVSVIDNLFPEPKKVKRAYTGRVVLGIGLLYFFYRLMTIYMPISPTLGPLLYKTRLMVVIDFKNFILICTPIIISSGIVIHAIMYPDYPMNSELFRRAFHYAWFTMFLTFASDLEVNPRCPPINKTYMIAKSAADENFCFMGDYEDVSCVTTGFWPYALNIQYQVILKLILITLLYAMFSGTQMELASDSMTIWKYQRFRLVSDFEARLRLPPPFNIFSYIIMVVRYIFRLLTCYSCRKPKKEPPEERFKINDYTYWKSMASKYMQLKGEKETSGDLIKQQLERIDKVLQDAEYQIYVLRTIKSTLNDLEKVMQSSRIALEEINHEFIKSEEKQTHILSRQSPYPGTKVLRFPISDKYVPWEVLFSTYDPVVYTKPRTDFPTSVREYVDEDILLLRDKHGDNYKPPEMKWNIVSTSGAGVSIDRTSWIVKDDNTAVIYRLDSTGIPKNPIGRTGLRGRGALLRWGPNHAIFLIITRWQSPIGVMQSVSADSRSIEFIIGPSDQGSEWILPGGFMLNHETVYGVVRVQFLGGFDSTWTAEAMREFFRQFSVSKTEDSSSITRDIVSPTEYEDANFSCVMLQRGYLDDGLNTDNAWIEAEIWHLHYKVVCTLENKSLPRMRWKTSSSKLRSKMPPSQNNLLEKIIHKLEGTS